jgi:NAD(P)-dependent dehydrogenase (short-subunit alcohol dehydrogenase family)
VRLDGKVAVITGGGRGIGREIARQFVAEGAVVALAAPEADEIEATADEIEAGGGRALPVVTDIREPDQLTRLADTVTAELGVPDVLVNNSGIAGPNSVLWEIDPAEWDETIRINLTGTYLCCRAFLPAMVARESGSIVVIGSTTGKCPEPGRTPYAASKRGLVGLVRTLAWELGEHGIRVNLISPGSVEGPRIEAVMEGRAERQGQTVEEIKDEVMASSPLGRLTRPRDVAAAAVFLASEDATSITGEDLNVTAGRAMY